MLTCFILTDIVVNRDKKYHPPPSPQTPLQQPQQMPPPSFTTAPSQQASSLSLNEEEQMFLVVEGSRISSGDEVVEGSGTFQEDRWVVKDHDDALSSCCDLSFIIVSLIY